MRFSDWQLNRLRDSLRAYHLYEHSHEGAYFTWKDVREAILEYTGVQIGIDVRKGAERLRQFVEGIKDKNNPGHKKYPVPKDPWLTAIVEFVTSDEIKLLSKDELNEYAPHYQAPLRLLEYLDQDFDEKRLIPPAELEGVYQVRQTDNDEFIVRELTLQRPSEDGLIHIIETEDVFENMAAAYFGDWTLKQRREERNSQIKHGGWAILTPEDNLFFFLKKESNGRNRYYFTVAADLALWTDSPHMRLVLLHHDFPLELEEKDIEEGVITEQVVSQTVNNIMMFDRTV